MNFKIKQIFDNLTSTLQYFSLATIKNNFSNHFLFI